MSEQELSDAGFASVGKDVRVSRKASIYGAGRIHIGDHSRIDDFCVLSAGEGGIAIGRYVHVAISTSLIGSGRITLNDFCNVSGKVSIYSSSDDFTGGAMTGPLVPEAFTDVTELPVVLGRHVIIGSNTVILPGSDIGDGAAVGSLSLVKGTLAANGVHSGIPAKKIGERGTDFYALEKQMNDGSG